MPVHTQAEGIFAEMVETALLKAFSEQNVPGYETSTVASAFFRVWMKELGNAYYFLFKKNLSVTNVQLAELLALVSSCSTNRLTGVGSGTLHFVAQADFVTTVEGLLAAFPDDGDGPETHRRKAKWFATTYRHLLLNTVVIDHFYGSCSVHLPPHLDTNLVRVCGLSGYIHSCGRNVFVRNVRKAKKEHFFEALERYLIRYGATAHKRLFFTVYAHEDFTPFDRDQERELANGLDDVKIHIDKFYMNGEVLVKVIAGLRSQFAAAIEVPEPGDFRTRHAATRSQPDIDTDRTLWLITDYKRTGNESERYYICYDQLYANKNQIHIFDENKPAWVAHTTISHTLMAAMINITMPYWPADKVVLLDPFVGSGTTWLESFKYGRIAVTGGDNSALALRAAADNARFFSLPTVQLRAMSAFVRRVARQVETGDAQSDTGGGQLTITDAKLAESISRLARSWGSESLGDDNYALDVLNAQDELNARVVFYVALRAFKRHAQALERHQENWPEAFAREAMTLVEQLDSLAKLNDRARKELSTDGVLVECVGPYSRSVSIGLPYLARFCAALEESPLRRRSASDLRMYAIEMGGRLDAIITDPPYGFNTDEDAETLASLYAEVISEAVSALSDDGQLVICLPERSTIGKSPLMFTHRSVITHQVITFAEIAGREVISPCRALPGPRELFSPPYYWKSDRGLSRSLLHFRLRPRRQ